MYLRAFLSDSPEKLQSARIAAALAVFAVSLIVFGFFWDTPAGIVGGIWRIIRSQAGLITDSIAIGGMGAAFVNSGLVTLICIGLLCLLRMPFTGISIASLFLMAGFSLFGKDIWNIFPIIFGGFLYARFRREPFGRYIYISLFGTALSPVVTEIVNVGGENAAAWYTVGVGIGVGIGFILPAVASFTLRVHQGYNLYNVGFTAGLIGMVLASFFKSFGHVFETRLEWSAGNNLPLAVFLFCLFGVMGAAGFLWNGHSPRGLLRITRHSGRLVADFVLHDGLPVTMMNMACVGAAATAYVLFVGGELNGPTIGGIFTICGFGAFGKHLKNILPVILGVIVSSIFTVWTLDEPNTLLAALFATGLAPIAGQFGWGWGMLAGAIHASVVLNTGFLHGGLNLYNNGFSAGLVCIVLVPLIESLRKET